MNKNCVRKIVELAESLDWSAYHDNGEFEFQRNSPAGQDFNMTIAAESLSELNENIYERWRDFDCSEEAYLWLDESGHGKNGAPYNMKDVYEDMEACQEMIRELAGKFGELDYADFLPKSQDKSSRDEAR